MHTSHQKLLELVKIERKTLTEILTHLKVINDKKIFVKMGYHNLLSYCVKELGYSESAAYRRISALRLEKKMPKVKKEIAKGNINLSTATKLNHLIEQKRKESGKKVRTDELLNLVKGKSTKEAEVIARKKLQLEPKKRKLTIEMSEEAYQAWVEYKGKHIAKRMTDEALLLMAIKIKVKEVRSYRRAKPHRSHNPRFIEAKTKRVVHKRANYCCEWPGCNSKFGLEIDHIRPVSKGGKGNFENLQLLCRNHNAFKSNN